MVTIKPFTKDLKGLDVKKDIKKTSGVLRVVKKAVDGLFAKVVTNTIAKKLFADTYKKVRCKILKQVPCKIHLKK